MKLIKNIWSKHSGEILCFAGTVCIIGGVAVCALDEAPKAVRLKERDQQVRKMNGMPDMSKIEKVRTTVKTYKKTIGLVTTGLVCFECAFLEKRRNFAALNAAYEIAKTSTREYGEYRKMVAEKIGDEAEKEIRSVIAQKREDETPVQNKTVYIATGDTLYKDAISGRYFMSDPNHVQRAFNCLNQTIIQENSAVLNELYAELGLDYTMIGDKLGWGTGTMVDFSLVPIITEDERPCLEIQCYPDPTFI